MVIKSSSFEPVLAPLWAQSLAECDPELARLVGVFSYLAAAIQENVSGVLIDRGTTIVDGVRHYNFNAPIAFWIGCSFVSAALSATLWRVRARN